MSNNESMPEYQKKPALRHIAIFGAAARMGGSVADFLRYAAPDITLRLITSTPERLASIAAGFPEAEAVVANYFDLGSLKLALAGIDGVFVVTPSGLNETLAMTNFIAAARAVGSIKHIIRVVGYEPEGTLRRLPETLATRRGDGSQHFIAKAMLDESALPVTFLNCGATMMDNFMWFKRPILERDVFVYPPRYIPFIDVRDFGEIAGRLLLSDDARHITQFHTVNNGYDQLTSPEIAQMLADVLRRKIQYDGTRESFLREFGPFINARHGQPDEAEYRWDFLNFELSNSVVWALNNFAERILGRRPTTLRSWLMEHRHSFIR